MPSSRYPAYPLITNDPFLSIWSFADELNSDATRHWTGSFQTLCCAVRIDGKTYRCMNPDPQDIPAARQFSVEVTPTRTVYTFEQNSVRFRMSFLSPLLPFDLEVLSRPATYVIFEAESADGAPHDVSVFFSITGELADGNNDPGYRSKNGRNMTWSRLRKGALDLLNMGRTDQQILSKCGDNVRIDWGYACLAVPRGTETCLMDYWPAVMEFSSTGNLPESDNCALNSPFNKNWIAACCVLPLNVTPGKTASARVITAYNDFYSIEYLHRWLKGYWTLATPAFDDMVLKAWNEFETLDEKCRAFDAELLADAEAAGGSDYAKLLAIAFRQAVAAHKLVADADGTPLFFSKENFSNGCIATVDVTYPSAPLFLLMQPALLKGMLIPILEYAATADWKYPFAPHDLGTYPLANGQVYGGPDSQMPVEECGNMLILAAAIGKFTNDLAFLKKYAATFRRWAEYLGDKGYNPENQLCTDDFAGRLAHNTNLSVKAIIGLAGYSVIAGLLDEPVLEKRFRNLAEEFAKRWVQDADDGDHFRLAFDQPGTWSQKYNLVWDRLLGLRLFPPAVAEKEMAFYRRIQNVYGLPLDNRKEYTKIDWILWSATLTGKDTDFRAILAPVAKWLEEGATRCPMTDWYETAGDGHCVGFRARSVVGGLFIRLLADPSIRLKWLAKVEK